MLRKPVGWMVRGILVGITAVVLLFGFTGIGSEKATPNTEPKANGEAAPLSWARKFRDTFVLNRSFADHFKGTSEEATATLHKELAKLTGEPVDDVILTLSTDKRTLIVEYSEKRAQKVEPTVTHLLAKMGWWTDPRMERQQAFDRALEPFRLEVEKHRLIVGMCAVEAGKLRDTAGIVDSDIESANSVVSHSGIPKEKLTAEQITEFNSYITAKIKFLNAKAILEAAELRYSDASGGGATLDMHVRE